MYYIFFSLFFLKIFIHHVFLNIFHLCNEEMLYLWQSFVFLKAEKEKKLLSKDVKMSLEEKKIYNNDTKKDKSSKIDNKLIDNMLQMMVQKEMVTRRIRHKMKDQIQQKQQFVCLNLVWKGFKEKSIYQESYTSNEHRKRIKRRNGNQIYWK